MAGGNVGGISGRSQYPFRGMCCKSFHLSLCLKRQIMNEKWLKYIVTITPKRVKGKLSKHCIASSPY